ncbi:hypothetical protein HanRHA438_Chr16g0763421 [Helianthus annuus]|nr:hypothetical protein HanIR_Chr16g0816681 [Helianthus annuus]KAJ0836135.1 hypothetical protein HanRHA438_Chr16g0763421 [Helianthus annuus]
MMFVLWLTPRPASRLTPREARGKRLDTRFRLFKPCIHVMHHTIVALL